MGKSSQRKGRRGELELSRILAGYGYDLRPGRPATFGEEPDIIGLPGIHVEVKRREQTDLAAALKQAADDAEKFGDGLPAVFTRGNRERWRVVMALDDFMKLYQRGRALCGKTKETDCQR